MPRAVVSNGMRTRAPRIPASAALVSWSRRATHRKPAPLFIQSALQAVQQWRYKPTFLNGEPVEIDTFITVVYNINR